MDNVLGVRLRRRVDMVGFLEECSNWERLEIRVKKGKSSMLLIMEKLEFVFSLFKSTEFRI